MDTRESLPYESQSVQGQYKLTGLTNTWPGDDSYAFQFDKIKQIRGFRFKAIKTAGATAGATLKYTLDAPSEPAANSALNYIPADPNTTALPYNELDDGVWSEYIDLSKDENNTLPLQRIDFLPTADTWTIIMEID